MKFNTLDKRPFEKQFRFDGVASALAVCGLFALNALLFVLFSIDMIERRPLVRLLMPLLGLIALARFIRGQLFYSMTAAQRVRRIGLLSLAIAVIVFQFSFRADLWWFDRNMRSRVEQAGGIDFVRNWAVGLINDARVPHGSVMADKTPAGIRTAFSGYGIMKETPKGDMPGAINIFKGGWDSGCGLTIEATTPLEFAGDEHRVWEPGVYIWLQ